MSNVCKVIIIGRLGRDPEARPYKNGEGETVSFSLAVNRRLRDGEKTEWHQIKAFGKNAQNCKLYLRKGDLCCIEGRLENSVYDKEGVQHKSTQVVAERISYLSKSKRSVEKQAQEESDVAVPF
ncbi:MAG: single-stranded DNA-binding protein [Bradymonadales bacterium]